MPIKLRIYISVVCLTLTSASTAQSADWRRDLIMGTIDASSREARSAVANGLLSEIEAIGSYVPSLTPEQRAWLQRENDALNNLSGQAISEKISSIARSQEYQLDTLDTLLDNMVESLECVADSSVSESRELECWLWVVYELTEGNTINDAIARLHAGGTVRFSESIRTQLRLDYSRDNPWGGYTLYARELIRNLIIPYTRAQ